jgi:tetratricopeptide (TPR) repeat protein
MAEGYRVQRRYDEAEPLFQRAIAMTEETLGPDHPQVARTLTGYAMLLRASKRTGEAARWEQRAKSIAANRSRETAVGVLTVDYGDLRDSALRERGK